MGRSAYFKFMNPHSREKYRIREFGINVTKHANISSIIEKKAKLCPFNI
jgi:hypothetical protein